MPPPPAPPRTVAEPIDPVLLTGRHHPPDDRHLVTVRRGDTLWDLAARGLGPDAGDAEVAAEWPRWYAANRDVVGVDPGRAEGITGFWRACERVEAAGRQANAHSWSSVIVQAASLAVSWATPVCRQFEVKPLANPMQDELAEESYAPVDGFMPQPTGPGLGITVCEEEVERWRADR